MRQVTVYSTPSVEQLAILCANVPGAANGGPSSGVNVSTGSPPPPPPPPSTDFGLGLYAAGGGGLLGGILIGLLLVAVLSRVLVGRRAELPVIVSKILWAPDPPSAGEQPIRRVHAEMYDKDIDFKTEDGSKWA